MTVKELFTILKKDYILKGKGDTEVTIVTSSNGANMDGQIGIDCIFPETIAGNTGETLIGCMIEVKGRICKWEVAYDAGVESCGY